MIWYSPEGSFCSGKCLPSTISQACPLSFSSSFLTPKTILTFLPIIRKCLKSKMDLSKQGFELLNKRKRTKLINFNRYSIFESSGATLFSGSRNFKSLGSLMRLRRTFIITREKKVLIKRITSFGLLRCLILLRFIMGFDESLLLQVSNQGKNIF